MSRSTFFDRLAPINSNQATSAILGDGAVALLKSPQNRMSYLHNAPGGSREGELRCENIERPANSYKPPDPRYTPVIGKSRKFGSPDTQTFIFSTIAVATSDFLTSRGICNFT
jgi:hypothetical protein